MKILIACNLLTSVSSLAYPNHMQFWYRLGKSNKYDLLFFTPRRMSIDRMRNEAAKMAMEQECDYLFFYDDDVLLPYDCLDKLVETQCAIAAGVTYVRSYPFDPMVFKYVDDAAIRRMVCYKDFNKEVRDDGSFLREDGIVYCDAVGFSCCLIDVKQTLLKLAPPYFVTGQRNTEDVYFCHKVRTELEDGEFVGICVHTEVKTGHILDNYYVNDETKSALIEFEELLGSSKKKGRGDRSQDYRDEVYKKLGIKNEEA